MKSIDDQAILTMISPQAYGIIDDHIREKNEHIQKLTKACEIMKQALKAIRETNISGANIYAGAESMEFDAFEALEQVEKVFGDK